MFVPSRLPSLMVPYRRMKGEDTSCEGSCGGPHGSAVILVHTNLFSIDCVPTLAETMSVIFPELTDKQDDIQKIIRGEEEAFNATLDRGLEIFEQVVQQIGHSKTFPGEDAFKLYDTYGFPLDLTELLATERGLKVDVGVFMELMEKQRDRSRVSGTSVSIASAESSTADRVDLSGRDILQRFAKDIAENRLTFVGYDQLDIEAMIVKGDRHLLVLDATPFYGEAGGQVGDQGVLKVANQTLNVHDTQKVGNLNVHILKEPVPTIVGEKYKPRSTLCGVARSCATTLPHISSTRH